MTYLVAAARKAGITDISEIAASAYDYNPPSHFGHLFDNPDALERWQNYCSVRGQLTLPPPPRVNSQGATPTLVGLGAPGRPAAASLLGAQRAITLATPNVNDPEPPRFALGVCTIQLYN